MLCSASVVNSEIVVKSYLLEVPSDLDRRRRKYGPRSKNLLCQRCFQQRQSGYCC